MHSQHTTRRDFLSWTSHGLGSAALASLMLADGSASAGITPAQSRDPWPHFEAPAKRVIHICAFGGVSQVDSFDYKPLLNQRHGQVLSFDDARQLAKTGKRTEQHLMGSPWKFRQYGQTGRHVSQLFPHTAAHIDD
ncbi:MAG: DUF1501 domain-containing protein, partial [Planctomycetaceae bacterium]|nr:DUF1501 domain-containing protein [Planctomycetaceae bacterium]